MPRDYYIFHYDPTPSQLYPNGVWLWDMTGGYATQAHAAVEILRLRTLNPGVSYEARRIGD
jgi:hypothetical protein